MEVLMRNLVESLEKNFKLEKLSAGEFARIKVSGMNFVIERYDAKGLGNVSVMSAKGFFGLMKMDTLIINPTECDMPLFSYDRIHAMGNDTLILELYDTFIQNVSMEPMSKIKTEYANLPEHDLGSHWYDNIKLTQSDAKKGKKKTTPDFDKYTTAYLNTYIEMAKNAPACDRAQKKEKASVYVNGLLENGGPSTDIFKKHYGEEKTAKLFKEILFGVTT